MGIRSVRNLRIADSFAARAKKRATPPVRRKRRTTLADLVTAS
jgi:hypothetical protein